jgi:hypothetical protein
VPLRSNSILMARVREAEFLDVDSRRRSALLRAYMFVHLKKDLNVKPVNWDGCDDPVDRIDEQLAGVTGGTMTSYGLRKEIQRQLAAIRTDLDSFNDQEAFALMTSGYRMAEQEFAKFIQKFLPGPVAPVDWDFLAIEPAMNAAPGHEEEHRRLKEILAVAASKGFKVWKLKPWLKVCGALAGIGLLGLLYKVCSWAWTSPLLTVGGAVKFAAVAAAIAVIGPIAVKLTNYRKTLSEIGIGIATAVFGFVAAKIHLCCFDKLYLEAGRCRPDPGAESGSQDCPGD